ncbi:MAG: TetR/AcrR family transcriptional regulator [Candidatus Nitrospinota bacterium M3_3B_026]
MAPKVSDEYLKARREQILKAAAALFSRKGFHKTTMRDICRKTRLSPGAVYRYFKSKEDIIKAMAEDELGRNIPLLRGARDRSDTFKALEDLADFFFSMLDDPKTCDPRLDMELWAEALRNRKIMNIQRRSKNAHLKALADIIREARRKKKIVSGVDPDALARVMVGLHAGLIVQKGLEPDIDVWGYVSVVKRMMRAIVVEEEECEDQ